MLDDGRQSGVRRGTVMWLGPGALLASNSGWGWGWGSEVTLGCFGWTLSVTGVGRESRAPMGTVRLL